MNKSNDITAAILSSLAIIIQLILFLLSTISKSVGISNIFVMNNLIPFVTLLAVFLSLTSAGIYSYIYKNHYYSFKQRGNIKPLNWLKKKIFEESVPVRTLVDKKEIGRRFLLTASFILLFSTFLFIISTIIYMYTNEVFATFLNIQVGYWQTISYLTLWVSTSLILFIWIVNEREKANQFKEEDYILNLYDSLREHGYLSVTVRSAQTIKKNYSSRYVIATFGTDVSQESTFLKTSYDGKRIFTEFDTREDFINDIKNDNVSKDGNIQDSVQENGQ